MDEKTTIKTPEFGEKVRNEASRLQESGRDPNQIAAILCRQDPKGHNYGIGIVLDGQGKPLMSSSTLLAYASQELKNSQSGSYMNSATVMEDLTKAVLKWQRIPKEYWASFKLILPSDAGTGAVQTAFETALFLNASIKTLGVEKWGWPAYKAMAKVARLSFKEYSEEGVIKEPQTLAIYQAGPMNTTGLVPNSQRVEKRAKSAKEYKTPVILDRAYSGFEFARDLSQKSYNEIMTASYEEQIQPFLKANIPFFLALSPTKAFVTFALRPCGFLLAYEPDASQRKTLSSALNLTVRARGSSFEHPVTRGFVKAFIQDLPKLEKEHETALRRLTEAEVMWKKLTKGTPMESLFSNAYAGLFRNPEAQKDADLHIYNDHLYPVFSGSRCRLNITGLPNNESLAKSHVDVFSRYCR